MIGFMIDRRPMRLDLQCGKLTQALRIATHTAIPVYGILRSSNVALAAGGREKDSPVQSYLLVYPPIERGLLPVARARPQQKQKGTA